MVSQITGSSTSDSATPNRLSEISSEQFLKIIFSELQRQDPLQPNDSSKLLEQLSSIRSIQSDIELGSKLETLVGQNQLASAGALIGKRVIGLDENLLRVSGTVAGVNRTDDGPVLRLDNGFRIPFDYIEQLLGEAPATTPEPTDPADPADPGDPADPVDPIDDEPADPGDPTDPADPADPGDDA